MEAQVIRKICHIFLKAISSLILASNFAHALNCSGKISLSTAQSSVAYADLGKITNRLAAKDPAVLENGTDKFVLVRRFVSGDSNARGGDIMVDLPFNRIDKKFNITYGRQKIKDFAIDPAFLDMDLSSVVQVGENICGGPACKSIPTGQAFDKILSKLMECNGGKKGVFEFDDAFVLLDMVLIENLPIGEGAIIQKTQGKLRLKALIISQ